MDNLRKEGTEQIIELRELRGNLPTTLNETQQALLPYEGVMQMLWWGVWIITLVFILSRVIIKIMYSHREHP